MNLKRSVIPLLFFLAIGLAIFLVVSKPDNSPQTAKEKSRAIETVTIKLAANAPSIPLFVKVTTPQHAHIKSAIAADVTQLHQLNGLSVSKGELLLALDDREVKITIEQRQADVQDIQAQIDSENLAHENELYVIGDKQTKRAKHNRAQIIKGHKIRLASLRARYKKTGALLKLAKLDLQRTQITAPFDGRITALHVSSGDRVRPGDALVDMYDEQAIELSGPVPSRYITTLQNALDAGKQLQAHLSGSNSGLSITFDRLSGQIGESSGAIDAIFKLPASTATLPLGLQLTITLNLPASKTSFVLPDSAIYGRDKIYKVKDNRLHGIKIKVIGEYKAQETGQYNVVSSEQIQNGDVVMITQLPDAIENLLIEPVNAVTPTHKP